MFDILTTAAIADELADLLIGGRIQRTGLRDRATVVLEVYGQHKRRYLVASLSGREPVCYLSSTDPGSDAATITPFSLLLRKYLRGGLITGIEQTPLDRIIRLHVSKLARSAEEKDNVQSEEQDLDENDTDDSDLPLVFSTLTIELMGRRSNIILIDDQGTVLDSIKRVTPEMSRVRPVLPHRPYVPPPPAGKLDPRTMPAGALREALADRDGGELLANALVAVVSSVSPQIGREVAWRSTGSDQNRIADGGQDEIERVANALRELFAHLEDPSWSPMVYRDAEGMPIAYSAIPLGHMNNRAEGIAASSMSEAVEQSLAGRQSEGKHSARRERLMASLNQTRQRIESRLMVLSKQQRDLKDADRFRRWGEGIFASIWQIQAGQAELEYRGEVIPLDPAITPSDQAQQYFARYRRSERGEAEVDSVLTETKTDLAYVDQLLVLASMSTTFDDIEAIRSEWESSPVRQCGQRADAPRKPKRPKRVETFSGAHGGRIAIGRSGHQNDLLTFELAGPDDYWLHARGVPGSHVIFKPDGVGEAHLDDALLEAASYAAWNSGGRESRSVEVDICLRRYVRKVKGAGPGLVTYRNERTVNVKPMPAPR